MYSIGIDMGGHKISVGLFSEGSLLKTITFPTPKNKKKAIEKIFDVIHSFNITSKIKGIGFGVPGQVEDKVIIKLTNLKGWENTYVANLVRRKFGQVDFALLNDSDAAVLAEQSYWKKRNIVCITLGTGVGSGVIVDGRLVQGVEVGHTCVSADGPKCSCGARGCLEEYISTRAIKRAALKSFRRKLEPVEVEKLAREGNKKAINIYYTAGKYLGIGLKNVTNIFKPDIIVLAGGLAAASDLMMKGINESMATALYNTKVVKTRLNANSGVIGAALAVSIIF